VRYRYKIAFTEVDFALRLFSADFYHFAERAFETFLQETGLGFRRMITELGIGLPATETRCRYLAGLAYEDEFEVTVSVRDLDDRGFVTDFEVVRLDDGKVAAYGYMTRRFLDMRTGAGTTHVPDEAATVFRAMADRRSLPSYEEREAAHAASRPNGPSPTERT
jgi:acyl-CoA thioesterase FadM